MYNSNIKLSFGYFFKIRMSLPIPQIKNITIIRISIINKDASYCLALNHHMSSVSIIRIAVSN